MSLWYIQGRDYSNINIIGPILIIMSTAYEKLLRIHLLGISTSISLHANRIPVVFYNIGNEEEKKMEYVRVAATGELPVGAMIRVLVNGREVLLANVDGSYYAIANKCSHAGGSLARGVLKREVLSHVLIAALNLL